MQHVLMRLPIIAALLIAAAGVLATGCTNSFAPAPAGGLGPDTKRAAFQSQCAQNVVTCTVIFPTAAIGIEPNEDQELVVTAGGFQIIGSDGDGAEEVYLVGRDSTPGETATEIFFSWSVGAADEDPCTLAPGDEFSTDADTRVRLQTGFHYIRLTVRNDLPPLDAIESDGCGTLRNFSRLDFLEIEIEIIDD